MFSAAAAGRLPSCGNAADRTVDVPTSRPVREYRGRLMGHVDQGRQAATDGFWSAHFRRQPEQLVPAIAWRRSAATCRISHMLRSSALLCWASRPGDRNQHRGSGRVPEGERQVLPLQLLHGYQTICTARSFEGSERCRVRPPRAGRDLRLSIKSSSPTTRTHSPTSRIFRPRTMGGSK